MLRWLRRPMPCPTCDAELPRELATRAAESASKLADERASRVADERASELADERASRVADERASELADEMSRDGALSCPACGQPLLAVRIAGPAPRVAAAIVDLIVLAATALPLQLLLWKVAPPPDPIAGATGLHRWIELLVLPVPTLLAMIVPLLVMTALYLALHWGLMGRTLGQRALGLRVVNGRGEDPGWVRSTLRVAATGIGLLPAGLGAAWMLFDDERRTFQDHVAGTWVVLGP